MQPIRHSGIRRLGPLFISFFLLHVSVGRAAVSAPDPQANFLRNPGFEAAAADEFWEKRTPDSIERALAIVKGDGARSGERHARITQRQPVASRWRQGGDGVLKAASGSAVRLSGWIRTDLGEEGYATLRLYCIGADASAPILAQPQTRPVRGKSDWKRVSLRANVPADTGYLMVYLELRDGVGTADFDDLCLSIVGCPEPAHAAPDLLLISDVSGDDSVVRTLRTIYPRRLLVPAPGAPPPWDQARGALVFFRGAGAAFDAGALEGLARRGFPVVMDLGAYGRWRSLEVREVEAGAMPSMRIVAEHPATRGYALGDAIPWWARKGACWTQRVLSGGGPGRVLAESSLGGALLVAEAVGRGEVLATDLVGLPEPAYNVSGSFNKYLFAGNLLGGGVRHGRHHAERLPYDGFVDAMRALAAELPALRVADEGPAHGEYRIHSLTLGDARAPTYLIYGVTHGSEWEPAYGLLTLARLLAGTPGLTPFDARRHALKLIPILNPSGYDLWTRQNAARVDLNRNGGEWWGAFVGRDSNQDGVWGPGDYDWKGRAPFSEPETRTLRDLCARIDLRAALDFHGNSGGRGNNRLMILPLTARDGNEERADDAACAFNAAMRGRYAFLEAKRPGVEQYEIENVALDGERPTLIETVCKGRWGFLCEVPAGYAGTYGLAVQTDIVVETCLAFLRAYVGER